MTRRRDRTGDRRQETENNSAAVVLTHCVQLIVEIT